MRFFFAVLAIGTVIASSGCSSSSAASQQGVQAQVVNSQIGLGPTRLAFGLIASDGSLLQDASGKVHLEAEVGKASLGDVDLKSVALFETPTHTQANGTPVEPIATMYITNVDLAQTGWWSADISVKAAGKQYDDIKTRFFVDDHTTVPAIGAMAPRSTQPTIADVPDVSDIDSSTPPRPQLHDMTVAQAIDSKKPTVVAFATPAFCQTRFCGPVVDTVVAPLAQDYAGRANFIHIEPYKLADARQGRLVPVPEMEQWGLTSEPYLFVLDSSGKVAAKFEGITQKDEVAAALDKVLAVDH